MGGSRDCGRRDGPGSFHEIAGAAWKSVRGGLRPVGHGCFHGWLQQSLIGLGSRIGDITQELHIFSQMALPCLVITWQPVSSINLTSDVWPPVVTRTASLGSGGVC